MVKCPQWFFKSTLLSIPSGLYDVLKAGAAAHRSHLVNQFDFLQYPLGVDTPAALPCSPPQHCPTGMASVAFMGSLLPGAEMGSEVSTLLTGGGCTSHRKLVRGASLLSIPSTFAPFPEEAQENRAPAGNSSAHSSKITAPHETAGEGQDTEGLIPGLLDEVALLCLARLPTSDWGTARQVSSSWRKLFASQERGDVLTPVRSKLGTVENWVFVKPAQISPFTGGDSWRAMELERGLVRVVPPMPGQGSRYSWTGAGVAAAGGKLVCMGWKDDNIYAFTGSIFPAALSSFLWLYCPILNRWEEKKGVPSPRTHFACASDGRRVYLVGGRRGGSIMEQGEQLATAWVYDAEQDRWALKHVSESSPQEVVLCWVQDHLGFPG